MVAAAATPPTERAQRQQHTVAAPVAAADDTPATAGPIGGPDASDANDVAVPPLSQVMVRAPRRGASMMRRARH
jgi:hypothetical protein